MVGGKNAQVNRLYVKVSAWPVSGNHLAIRRTFLRESGLFKQVKIKYTQG